MTQTATKTPAPKTTNAKAPKTPAPKNAKGSKNAPAPAPTAPDDSALLSDLNVGWNAYAKRAIVALVAHGVPGSGKGRKALASMFKSGADLV